MKLRIEKEDKIKVKKYYKRTFPHYGVMHDDQLYDYIMYVAGLCYRFLHKRKNLELKIIELTEEEKLVIEKDIANTKDDELADFYKELLEVVEILKKYYNLDGTMKS